MVFYFIDTMFSILSLMLIATSENNKLFNNYQAVILVLNDKFDMSNNNQHVAKEIVKTFIYVF